MSSSPTTIRIAAKARADGQPFRATMRFDALVS
jgi:hypothetical protein